MSEARSTRLTSYLLDTKRYSDSTTRRLAAEDTSLRGPVPTKILLNRPSAPPARVSSIALLLGERDAALARSRRPGLTPQLDTDPLRGRPGMAAQLPPDTKGRTPTFDFQIMKDQLEGDYTRSGVERSSVTRESLRDLEALRLRDVLKAVSSRTGAETLRDRSDWLRRLNECAISTQFGAHR
eukprot:TRINITY_DN10917_c0_g1_i1.p1 TRINITY_DN10917_c0_g1~~TRINITY_DN10917_c0_g1_i1.p1  ORF type:complete len:182 (-),score=26.32 TRINITY_DN10917_c0_g1_i1:335-880(-)